MSNHRSGTTMTDSSLQDLQAASYISLTTYRKSGAEVTRPIWAVYGDGVFFAFSAGAAGKVKRLRNSNRARIARCDARGKFLGDWFEASADLVETEQHIDRALHQLRKKYGWQMWVADKGAKLTGRFDQRAYLEIRLSE